VETVEALIHPRILQHRAGAFPGPVCSAWGPRGGRPQRPGLRDQWGGLVIDLTPMKGIRVDSSPRTVCAEGGVLWRELDHVILVIGDRYSLCRHL